MGGGHEELRLDYVYVCMCTYHDSVCGEVGGFQIELYHINAENSSMHFWKVLSSHQIKCCTNSAVHLQQHN